MRKHTILLLFALCACSAQNTDLENIITDQSLDNHLRTQQEKHIDDEVPTLQHDSKLNEELDAKKTTTSETDKPIEMTEEITYGSVRYKDTTISFKTLPSVNDSSKEQGTSGYVSKGSDGLNRKEVQDVYINGKYSHTETVKETYIVSKPIAEQKWIGTKEPVDEELEEINYIFYKTYDSFDTCNFEANELARINSKNGWLSTMCDGPNLYYTLRD